MTNLPEQAHNPGSAVAVRGQQDPYAIDQSMVKLPSLYLAQYSSKAFKARRVSFGAIYVGLGAEDPAPVVVGDSDGESLSKPVRFYVHGVQPGYQVVDDDAPYGKRTLRLGTPYPEALAEVGLDPRKVFQQSHYTITVPAYPLLPVRFIMGSRWGGNAARWVNSQIQIARMQEQNPLDLVFQVQTRPTSNESGEFVDAVVGFATLKAKDAAADKELVEKHAEALASAPVIADYETDESVDTAAAPSLD